MSERMWICCVMMRFQGVDIVHAIIYQEGPHIQADGTRSQKTIPIMGT